MRMAGIQCSMTRTEIKDQVKWKRASIKLCIYIYKYIPLFICNMQKGYIQKKKKTEPIKTTNILSHIYIVKLCTFSPFTVIHQNTSIYYSYHTIYSYHTYKKIYIIRNVYLYRERCRLGSIQDLGYADIEFVM